jgi:hypothetical protein
MGCAVDDSAVDFLESLIQDANNIASLVYCPQPQRGSTGRPERIMEACNAVMQVVDHRSDDFHALQKVSVHVCLLQWTSARPRGGDVLLRYCETLETELAFVMTACVIAMPHVPDVPHHAPLPACGSRPM